MILWELRLIIWWLSRIGSGCDGSNVLIGWIMWLRLPMGHHTDLLFLLSWKVIPESLGSTRRSSIFKQTSFSDSFFQLYTHTDHLCKVLGRTSDHLLVV